jgi:DNA polymerase
MPLWLDFETRSNCDLKVAGVYNYARDASTEVLCMSYAFNDEDVQTWTPAQPFPARVAEYDGQIRAHNAAFERLIFWYVLQKDFELEQFYCTAAQARANCAPGSLEDIGRFMGASMKKDHRGAALIRKCCVPPFKCTEQDLVDLIAYCEQDVRAMREISGLLRDLSPTELGDYHVNERINDQGVLVDVRLCRAAMRYATTESEDITRTVWEATGGLVGSVRSPRMREWVLERLTFEQLKLTVVKDKPSIDKTVRANLLACDDLDPAVREVVQAADDLWASSVAKFQRLAQLADVDDARVRGAFVFAGGSATGRASSYGAQVHNFTRKVAKSPAAVRQAMVRGHQLVPTHGPRITDVLRSMLRPALVPAPGHVLVVADWSAIEGRVNPWLAGSDAGEAKLDVFRSGLDPYIVNAAATYNVTYGDVTDSQRQVGKVQELALGFGGGVGAFAAMGRGYGLVVPEPEAQLMVNAWRRANFWAQPFWAALEFAYLSAMRQPGEEFSAGRVTYLYDRQHLWYVLPSGRVLCYPFAKFDEEGNLTYAKAAWKPMADATEWPRARLWRGLACENVTQATAHDLLRHALRELVWCTVLHVHDEIVLEVQEADAERALEWMREVMTTPPDWADGLPLAVGAKVMTRYGK